MAHVKQVCDGYNKKTLIGNWQQQRLYPNQPHREDINKKPRQIQQSITCLDGRGFQRTLPRLQRRNKWQTKERIVLNDGIQFQHTENKGGYPYGQPQKTSNIMSRPLNKNSDTIKDTDNHPNSQIRVKQKSYHIINQNNAKQIDNGRNILMYASDFKSTLPQHQQTLKQKRYGTSYGKAFGKAYEDARQRTTSQFNWTRKQAGCINSTHQQVVKPLTTMVCQIKKQVGDQKQRTGVQRSWVPQRDKCLSYSIGKGSNDFHPLNPPKNDIQTNLNINIGIHHLHPKLPEDGYFRHVRQDVTMRNNKNPCLRP